MNSIHILQHTNLNIQDEAIHIRREQGAQGKARENVRAEDTLQSGSENKAVESGGQGKSEGSVRDTISQNTQKRGPNTTQKQPQRPPDTKKSPKRCRGQKKTDFGRPGPPSRAPKGPKVDLQTGPTAQKSKIYMLYQKNIICGACLEPTEAAFGG